MNRAFYSVRFLARALGISKPTVHHRARKGNWPSRRIANRLEFSPPASLGISAPPTAPPAPSPGVSFADLRQPTAQQRALVRLSAVRCFFAFRGLSSDERILRSVCKFFGKSLSPRQLRRWLARYEKFGLNGLADQKQGHCGVKRKQGEAGA